MKLGWRVAKAGLALMVAIPVSLARADSGSKGAPLAIASSRANRSMSPPASLAPAGLWPADERAAALIAHANRKLANARFDEALALTGRARELLEPYGQKQRALRHKAHLEVTAATALVAFERNQEAIACFERALAIEPALELEATRTSPKVLRVFREARSAR
jgi:tetratricopeptide (TPR) repeat protein